MRRKIEKRVTVRVGGLQQKLDVTLSAMCVLSFLAGAGGFEYHTKMLPTQHCGRILLVSETMNVAEEGYL